MIRFPSNAWEGIHAPMKTLGTDCTNYFCTVQKHRYKIVPSSNTMTQTKKSRIIRKKGQEIDRSNLGMTHTRISQLLQNNFVDFIFEDKAIKGGIYL